MWGASAAWASMTRSLVFVEGLFFGHGQGPAKWAIPRVRNRGRAAATWATRNLMSINLLIGTSFSPGGPCSVVARGAPALREMFLPGFVEAYLWTYDNARSRAGARASNSRLMKRRDVRAAMQWFYAQVARDIPRDEPMTMTVLAEPSLR